MEHTLSRRALMKRVLAAGALAPVLGLLDKESHAGTLSPLAADEPSAKALYFAPDAAKISTGGAPTFKPGQHCGGCAHYQGKPSDPVAACEIFIGHSVPVGGWCMAWNARPG